jgi:hypothetical protein
MNKIKFAGVWPLGPLLSPLSSISEHRPGYAGSRGMGRAPNPKSTQSPSHPAIYSTKSKKRTPPTLLISKPSRHTRLNVVLSKTLGHNQVEDTVSISPTRPTSTYSTWWIIPLCCTESAFRISSCVQFFHTYLNSFQQAYRDAVDGVLNLFRPATCSVDHS